MPTSPSSPSEPALRVPPLAPDAGALRTAYLQLLKLCLCDLAGASTREVRWTADKRVFWRTLTDAAQLEHRAEGKDWPLDGLTMIGLDRLNDLQRCVESIVADDVAGDLIEAGAWRGGASILIRATLDTLAGRDRTLWVADSFQGFPRPEVTGRRADRELESDMNRIDFLAPSLEMVQEYFERFGVAEGVRFVPGFFEDTMDALRDRRWSLIRLDADTYRATRLTLEALYPGLSAGGYLVVDDYFHPYLPESCRKAVDDFRAANSIDEPIEQIDWNGARWRKQSEPTTPNPSMQPREPAVEPAPARVRGAGGDETMVPSDRELQLKDQVVALETALRAAQAELDRQAGSRLGQLVARARAVAKSDRR